MANKRGKRNDVVALSVLRKIFPPLIIFRSRRCNLPVRESHIELHWKYINGVVVPRRMPLTFRYGFDGLQIKIHRKLLKRKEWRAIRDWLASIPQREPVHEKENPVFKRETNVGCRLIIKPYDIFTLRSFPSFLGTGKSEPVEGNS